MIALLQRFRVGWVLAVSILAAASPAWVFAQDDAFSGLERRERVVLSDLDEPSDPGTRRTLREGRLPSRWARAKAQRSFRVASATAVRQKGSAPAAAVIPRSASTRSTAEWRDVTRGVRLLRKLLGRDRGDRGERARLRSLARDLKSQFQRARRSGEPLPANVGAALDSLESSLKQLETRAWAGKAWWDPSLYVNQLQSGPLVSSIRSLLEILETSAEDLARQQMSPPDRGGIGEGRRDPPPLLPDRAPPRPSLSGPLPAPTEWVLPPDAGSRTAGAALTLRAPGGKELTIRSFPNSAGRAVVRFLPHQTGEWTLALPGGRTLRKRIVEVPENGAVVTADRERPGVFSLQGKAFLPVGTNVAWVPWEDSVEKYLAHWEQYFENAAGNGQNWVRVWTCPWSLNLQPRGTPADEIQDEQAQRLDQVFESASRHGLRVQLVIDYHGMLDKEQSWDKSPFNAANGGPCREPAHFFTSPEARRLYKRRLEALVARYAAYPSLFAWEFWNEVDLTGGFDLDDVVDWHREMAAHLKRIDPYGHLVTTSTSGKDSRFDDLWRLEDIDFVQLHIYERKLAEGILREVRRLRRHGKPVLVGEAGQDWRGPDLELKHDPEGLGLHDALWSALACGSSGTGMYWWWDRYIAPRGLYTQFGPLAEAGAWLRPGADEKGIRPVGVKVLGHFTGVQATAVRAGDRVLVWLKDSEYVTSEARDTPRERKIEDVRIEVDLGSSQARWNLSRLDTWQGGRRAAGSLWARRGKAVLSVGAFRRDTALLLQER